LTSNALNVFKNAKINQQLGALPYRPCAVPSKKKCLSTVETSAQEITNY